MATGTTARKKTAKKETEAEKKPAVAADEAQEQADQKEQTFTYEQVQEMVNEAVKQALAAQSAPQTGAAPAKERVMLLWQAPVAKDNVQEFGPNGRFGRITGPSGSFYVPRDEFSQILDGTVRVFLDRRWLIVVSGLDADEREAFGVNYKEGEVLTRQAFDKLLEQGDKLLEIYQQLCEGHRRIVAKRVYEGWREHNRAVNRGLVKKLNSLCKKIDPEETTFKTVLAEMNAKDEDGDDEE